MRVRNIIRCAFVAITMLFAASISDVVNAQNSTYSPYSRYGLGELGNYCPAAYRGLGGVRYGLRSNRTINAAQPASYTACDSMTFMFDLSVHVDWSLFEDGAGKRNKFNGNLDYITLQFPLWKQHIAMSLGLLPYSKLGYQITLNGNVDDKYHYSKIYTGEGGITDLYAGLSGNLFDWVALGFNFYYMFGEVTNTRELIFQEAGLNSTTKVTDIDVSTIRLRYGLQLFHDFGKHSFVVGGIYEHKANINGTYTDVVVSTDIDTVPHNKNGLSMPSIFGVGGSYTWNRALTVALDYEYQFWSKAELMDEPLRDCNRISAGVEYRHNPYGKNYAERMFWRAGCSFSDSYIKAVGGKDLRVSIGMGFPLRTSGTLFNVTLEYNRRGISGGLWENGLQLTINAAVRENWFFKRKL